MADSGDAFRLVAAKVEVDRLEDEIWHQDAENASLRAEVLRLEGDCAVLRDLVRKIADLVCRGEVGDVK